MPSRFYNVVIDSRDPASLARWWAQVLDYKVVYEAPDEFVIAKEEDVEPMLIFVPSSDSKERKNRLHIDLAPDDQDAEVQRLLDLGAKHTDIGQRDVKWVVLADPEGNEFCVLTAR